MADLKKVFHSCRAYREQTLDDAANELEVSKTFLHQFLNGEGTSAPLKKKVLTYIYETELDRSIKELLRDTDVDPYDRIKTATA